MLVNTLIDPQFRRWLATLNLDDVTATTFLRSDGSVDLTADWTIATKNITLTAGTLTAEQITSTDDITMQGHLFTMGNAGAATDSVLSFLGSHNSGSITFDESRPKFDFGNADVEIAATLTAANIQVVNQVSWEDSTTQNYLRVQALDNAYPQHGVLSISLGGGPARTLTITADSIISQDYSTSGSPSFASGVTIGTLTLADGLITDSGGVISFGNEALTTTGLLTAAGLIVGDNENIEVGAGAVELGYDFRIYSDGTNPYMQWESPSGTFEHPRLKLLSYDITGTGAYVPVLKFGCNYNDSPYDLGMGILDYYLYVQDTTGSQDGTIVIPHNAFPATDEWGTIWYYSNGSEFIIDTKSGSGADIKIAADGDLLLDSKVRIGDTTAPTETFEVKADSIRVVDTQSPASNGAGTQGEIAWDPDYIYVCTATNTWERAALTGGY